MKILIDPKLAVFIRDLSDKQCADLLRCIFEYPNRECDLGLWVYMKKQIEEDAKKYAEKCERMAASRAMKSKQKSILFSGVKEVVEIENINKKNINKGSESSNANLPVENSVENDGNTPDEFFVDENFSFSRVLELKPKFECYLKLYPAPVIERADKTFQKKRKGQWVNMNSILLWLEQENAFYKEKQS